MKTGELPYPAAVIAEARARLGSDYEWAELSEAQRRAACRRCVEPWGTAELTLADLSSPGAADAEGSDLAPKGSETIRDPAESSASPIAVRFEDRAHPSREPDPSRSPLKPAAVEDPLMYSAGLVSASRGNTFRGRTAEAVAMAFILTATLPAPRRSGGGNKPALTPVAEARGQLPAVAPFLASVGADEGSLCLWCGTGLTGLPQWSIRAFFLPRRYLDLL